MSQTRLIWRESWKFAPREMASRLGETLIFKKSAKIAKKIQKHGRALIFPDFPEASILLHICSVSALPKCEKKRPRRPERRQMLENRPLACTRRKFQRKLKNDNGSIRALDGRPPGEAPGCQKPFKGGPRGFRGRPWAIRVLDLHALYSVFARC